MRISTCFLLSYLCFGSYVSKAQTTFSYTGSAQTYTVPACVYSINVDVKGAEGAGSSGQTTNVGGKGGRVQATVQVTPGEVLTIDVGQAGKVATSTGTGGWNGGGMGGTGCGGGGGASDIRRGGTALTNRIIVAGGGGGAGLCSTCTSTAKGGNGGDSTGANGWMIDQQHVAAGKGGSQTEGGAPGTEANPGTTGDLGIGGNGGGNYGGGGGGGYYGGGGGATNICCWGGGGGGGSSYTIPTSADVVHTQGFKTGNGEVVITPNAPGPATPSILYGPDLACIGSTVNYYVDSVPGADSYTWTFPAGTTINAGQGNATVEVTIGNMGGEISITATNICGTSNARTKPVAIEDCGNTSVNHTSGKMGLSISPNPADDLLNIQIADVGSTQLQVEIINIQGQAVYRSYTDKLTDRYFEEIDISLLSKGVYYLRVTGENFFVPQKLIIH